MAMVLHFARIQTDRIPSEPLPHIQHIPLTLERRLAELPTLLWQFVNVFFETLGW